MKLELKIYRCLCETETFLVNGIDAEHEDFGTKGDNSPDTAEDYGCGNMTFTGSTSTPEILEKYKINESEYLEIVSELEDKLSFGRCGWCI
jgi:hypothetical protein